MDIEEPASKKQKRCIENQSKHHQEQLFLALEECREQLYNKTQHALQLEAKVATLEARVSELEAIYEWHGG